MSFAPPEMPSSPQMAALPSSGIKRRAATDRAPAWLVALSAMVVVAMVAGAAYVLLDGGPDYPKEWDVRVASIAGWVESERGVTFEHPVQVEFLTEAEYSAVTTGGDAGGTTEESGDDGADDVVAQFRALGLISGELDLDEATDTLSDAGTLAFYDFRSEKVMVRGQELTPALRVTLAHELTHVAQDQSFDLGRIDALPSDRASALRALAEGDAERMEKRYVSDALDISERRQYEADRGSGGDAAEEIDAKVPPVLTAFFAAPYAFGPTLVQYLEQTGGQEAIDDAFRDPPGEEELFDPMVIDTSAAEPKAVEVSPPKGAEVLDSGAFGSTSWYLVLSARMDPRKALKATYGLGGDSYVAYRDAGNVCVRARAVGDDDQETAELRTALESWVAQSAEGTATVTDDDGTVQFQSCDPGAESPAVGSVSVEVLALPVTRTQVYLSYLDSGATDDQARCVADGVVERFTLDQILDDEYLGTPAGSATLGAVRAACS